MPEGWAVKYTFNRKLGEGGFGEVHEAYDSDGNRYAVKVVPKGDEQKTALLKKEFDFLSTLDHRRIVRVVDFDVDSPMGPIMVSELVDGVDLRTYVETHGRDDLPLVVAEVLDALRYLHGLGHVHGDIKPDSILVFDENGRPEVKLIDAGLDVEPGRRLPSLAGTPLYMAPEIIRNLKPDGRSDLYSLGVVLFEVLTGTNPFVGEDQQEVFKKQIEYQPPPPSRAAPEADSAWDEFTGRLMEKEPLLRYRDADEAGLALERASGRPGVYVDNLIMPRPNPMLVRHKETEQAVKCLMPPGGKGVLIHGERGCGARRILDRIKWLAKLDGQAVFAVSVNESMPAIVQVVEEILGPQADIPGLGASGSVGTVSEGGGRLAEVLGLFRSGLHSDREHILMIDGGEAMEAHELVLLGALADELKGRLGIVVSYEASDGASMPPGSDAYVDVAVPPLDAREIEAAVSLHLGTHALPSELAEEVRHATRGNAEALETTLDHLWRCGSLAFVCDGEGLRLTWDGHVETPGSDKGVLDERMPGLTSHAAEVLKVMTVGGGRVEIELLSHWLEPAALQAALQDLVTAGLIERSGAWVRLLVAGKSAEDALFHGSGDDEIARIGIRMAGLLESRTKGAYDLYRLGLLYLQGRRRRDAIRYLLDAGDNFSRFSVRDALLAYRKVLECELDPEAAGPVFERIGDLKLEQGDFEEAAKYFREAAPLMPSSLRKLGYVTGLRGEFAEAVATLTECEQAALERGDDLETARSRSDLGYIYAMQSKRDLSLAVLTKAQEFFEANVMHFEAGRASQRIAFMEWKAGDFSRSARASAAAKGYFDRAGDHKRAAVCLMGVGLCRRKAMDFESAEKCYREALCIFSRIRAIAEEASCRQNYAVLLLDQGNLQRASELNNQALAVNNLLGRYPQIVTCRILKGALALEAGSWQEAETILLGLLEYEPRPDAFDRSMIMRYLALAVGLGGRFDEAERYVNESLELARSVDDAEGGGQAVLAGSMIRLRSGDYAGAAADAGEALEILDRSASKVFANEARRVLGEARCLMGDRERGIPALSAAKDGFKIAEQSLHMGRALRALACASFADGDRSSAVSYLRKAADIFRAAGARYDYAVALLESGRQALKSAHLLPAKHHLQEAARIFRALKIEDLCQKAVSEMEKVPSGELEVGAVIALSKISQTLNSSNDLSTVLNLAMDLAIEYLGAERGVMMLEDDATGDLTTFTERAMDGDSLEDIIKISRSIVESVRNSKEPVIAADATRDTRFKHSRSIKAHNILSVMCVPLIMGNNLLGIIYLDSRDVSADFTELETEFVKAFANQVSLAIARAKLVGGLYEDMANLRVQAYEKYSYENIIGPGKKMQEVFRMVDKAARSNLRILITGENGTGKQVIANLVHRLSDRSDKPMIQVNCAAISRDLLEAELFGIEKQVATGVSARSGYFERANGGTIFLDEIGDMPDTTQMKVLRVLSENEFERVGGAKLIKVDVRVISATNKDLKALVDEGVFRKDLYYRVNHMRIHVPALRERGEDLPYLIDHFLAKYAEANSKPHLRMSREAVTALHQYLWPGNVRELETCIQHAVVKADGEEILVEHLHDEILESLRSRDPGMALGTDHEPLPEAVRKFERRLIVKALKESGGVKTRAARLLGIHESTLRKKVRSFGLE
jgi:Nif-specific regulatory protein